MSILPTRWDRWKGKRMTNVVWTDSSAAIAGTKIHVSRGGSGPTLLVLHHDIGTLDRLPFYDMLAENFDVLIPHHPGWGQSERPQWLRNPRDIAAMHQWLLAALGVRGVSLVGLGFGGWIAAEMASLAPTAFSRLVLVGAAGIKPPEGEIADQAIVSYTDYPRAGFHDPMHLMYFTEQPMGAYDAQEGLRYGATALTFSNKHFDPVAGSRLYNEYLEHTSSTPRSRASTASC
jgi:pimeloyl-ACP methyl ester carboxylesterase